MAVPIARVHLKVAHGALPALLTTPPKWKMLPPPLPCPCVAAILPKKPLAAKPSRADSDQRWDAHKTKPASSPGCAGRGSSSHKNATSPPPKPGRADAVERWDAHKKAASPAPASPSSSSSSSGTSSLASRRKWPPINRATSAERWDMHKKHRPSTQPEAELLDDGESSSTGSIDLDTDQEEEEEILWKPRAMYAGPGFAAAAPEPSMLPTPMSFLALVA